MEEKIVRAHRRPERQALAEQMRRAMTPNEGRLWERLWQVVYKGLRFGGSR